MSFEYWLPNAEGKKQILATENNALIIIGANGSGKSKLGAWIERQNLEKVHRISAQRDLNFGENIPLKNYEQAEDLVRYGSATDKANKHHRWGLGNADTTTLLHDFENVLAALIALKNNENDKYINQCREAEQKREEKPHTPKTVIDKLYEIWNSVFPQRELKLNDSKFYATFEGKEYSANQMSDGERSVLYLSAQVLCIPTDKTLIIDEPELHLHRSIMHRLWVTLEQQRQDCLFIYITHDTEFAAIHGNTDKFWIQEYDGRNWKLKKLEQNNELPENLLLEILGSRQNILFVEGEENSYDTQLYQILYPDYHVIACGSCTQVIARTKIFKNNPSLHHCKVYGIIDRDFRSEYEIEKYKNENIFTVDIAEIENLFLVEELVCFMAQHMGRNPDNVFQDVKKYIIGTRFENQKNEQIHKSIIAQIKYQLTVAKIPVSDLEMQKFLNEPLSTIIDYDKIKEAERGKFEAIAGKYADVIKFFNEKGLSKSIGEYFGIAKHEYCSTVLSLMKGKERENIIATLQKYLPREIPNIYGGNLAL